MSGSRELISLEDSLRGNSNIYVITIIGSVSVKIKEIDKVDPSVSQKYAYKAIIDQIIYKDTQSKVYSSNNEWYIAFPDSEKESVKKIKQKKNLYPEINDEIYIMNSEDINYSIIYYVKKMHKIFIYHSCVDSAKEIKPGEKYFFICSQPDKNNVLYGNIDYGIFPYTDKLETRINNIIKSK